MRKRAAAAPARVVFWPFSLFGNPGAEAGVHRLCAEFLDRMADYEEDPGVRQHALAGRTLTEAIEFTDAEAMARWREDLRARFAGYLKRGELPIVIGGNHLVALPVLEAYAALRDRCCVVSFDAHLDAYDLAGNREPLNHGNFLLHLARPPRLSIVNVGHRELMLRPDRVREVFDRDYGVQAIDARGVEAVAAEVAKHAGGFDRVHLDIDLDVLDPGAMPAVGSPIPFGLAARELLRFIDVLGPERLSGVTISEYNGTADRDGTGQQLVLWLVEYLLLRRAESR